MRGKKGEFMKNNNSKDYNGNSYSNNNNINYLFGILFCASFSRANRPSSYLSLMAELELQAFSLPLSIEIKLGGRC